MEESLPLIEKYRPHKLDDIVGNTNQIIFLKKFIETENIPNLLLTGEPGGGKTSAVIAFANEYLGPLYKDYCMELNASDERGIEVVRSKIKIFSQRKSCSDKYKIIILDESDNMTTTAQLALKRTMEQYEDTTKFLFTCNNIENIISGIQSRCKIMFFGTIERDHILNRLNTVCHKEHIKITQSALNSIIDLTENKSDLREMLNKLELVKANYVENETIGDEQIFNLCDKPSPLLIKDFIIFLKQKKLKAAIDIINDLKNDGYQSSDICITLNNEILNSDLSENMKRRIIECIGEYNMYFLEGNESLLQIGGLIVDIYKIFSL
jgi:replication factor C subunit 2/4